MIFIKKSSLLAFVCSAVFIITSSSILASDYHTQNIIDNKNEMDYSSQQSQQPNTSTDRQISEKMSGQSSPQDHDFSFISSDLLGMDKSSSFYYRLLLLH